MTVATPDHDCGELRRPTGVAVPSEAQIGNWNWFGHFA